MRILRVIIIAGLAACMVLFKAELVRASAPVKVAILDSGSNIDYKEGISLIDGTLRDFNGHGTLVAGIVKEVYPEAEFYIVKVVGRDGLIISEDAVILGLEWAISEHVDVINMSLRLKDSQRLHNMINKAYQQGIMIVAAAGNKSTKMGLLTTRDAIGLTEVACPAKYSEVIAVGALDRRGKIYDESIKGEKIEIFCKGYKGKEAGTSIASAYAAGFIAKIISENPNIDLRKIRDIMHQTSLPTGGNPKAVN